jgi:hypothetical protein
MIDFGDHYILEGQTVRKASFFEWAQWLEQNGASRTLAQDHIKTDVLVSTVFLGLDHNLLKHGDAPLLFETLVFGGHSDGRMCRYSTYSRALAGHVEVVEEVMELEGLANEQRAEIRRGMAERQEKADWDWIPRVLDV